MFKEDQAFSQSLNSAPRPPPSPHFPSISFTGDTQENWERDNLLTEEGGEDGGGAKLYDREKAGSSKNHPILSGYYLGFCLPQRKIEANAFAIRPGKLPKFQYMIGLWVVSWQILEEWESVC